jgi:hypothetical protein
MPHPQSPSSRQKYYINRDKMLRKLSMTVT